MSAPNVVDRAGGAGELRGEGGGAADGAAQSAVEAAGGSQSGRSRLSKQRSSGKRLCCKDKAPCKDANELYRASLEIVGGSCELTASQLRGELCKRKS